MNEVYSSDLRAPSMPIKRAQAQADKYYGFRHVHPGQLNTPHYLLVDNEGDIPFADAGLHISQTTHQIFNPVVQMTPQRLFQEAQAWPRPPRYHHRHQDKFCKRGATNSYGTRRYNKRNLGRTMQDVKGVPIGDFDAEEEVRHQDCALCGFEQEMEDEEENIYMDDAARIESQICEALGERSLATRANLVDHAVERWEVHNIEQLVGDGWVPVSFEDDFVDIEDESTDGDSDWDVVER